MLQITDTPVMQGTGSYLPSFWGRNEVAPVDEAAALGFELLVPAHDTTTRVGAAVRVMHAECWFNGRQALVPLSPPQPRGADAVCRFSLHQTHAASA